MGLPAIGTALKFPAQFNRFNFSSVAQHAGGNRKAPDAAVLLKKHEKIIMNSIDDMINNDQSLIGFLEDPQTQDKNLGFRAVVKQLDKDYILVIYLIKPHTLNFKEMYNFTFRRL